MASYSLHGYGLIEPCMALYGLHGYGLIQPYMALYGLILLAWLWPNYGLYEYGTHLEYPQDQTKLAEPIGR